MTLKRRQSRGATVKGRRRRSTASHKVPATQVSPHNGGSPATFAPDAVAAPPDTSSKRDRFVRAPPPPAAALMYRVDDAATVAGLGRSTVYALIKSGALRSRVIAGRRLIEARALRELLQPEVA
jgi:excisionase family DNA binding protein